MTDTNNDLPAQLENLNLGNETKRSEEASSPNLKKVSSQNRRPKHKSSDYRLNNRNNNDLDYIPTAVVIKNIPFSIKRELLLDIFSHLGLPTPFALNYHLDNGIFRGLAFANFRTPEETALVIKSIRGVELCGRKLKIEYKKSNGAERREYNSNTNANSNQINGSNENINSISNETNNEDLNKQNKGENEELDFNNEQINAFYEQIASFYEDDTREALIYPPVLDSTQRKIVHAIAERFGLYHYSQGVGEERHIRVSKTKPPQPQYVKREDKQPARRINNFKGNNSYNKDSQFYEKDNNSSGLSERSSSGPKSYKVNAKVFDATIAYPIRQPTLPDLNNNFVLRKEELELEQKNSNTIVEAQ
ncbi:hypothetical protein K502DRAFT_343347 [Neoconidiobolus thromboides FSU 785]|nr:hypothetical protein K502DRAFT_343347 [Neoconidiobolus thromboides FSU 785]